VVVNYLQWQDTASLVRQLRAAPALRHGAAEVVIVDNDSPWNALIPQLRQLPGVSLRRWRNNRGFARAVKLARTDAHTGIIGFGLRDADGGRQRSAGPFPTLASSLARLLLPRRWR